MSNFAAALSRFTMAPDRAPVHRPLFRTAVLGVSIGALLAAQTGAAEVIDAGQTITVPGDHSSPWNLGADDLIVGEAGAGTLRVQDGGIVIPAGLQIGVLDTSSGAVVVSGAGSALSSTGLLTEVGIAGIGALTVSGGASFDTSGAMVLGRLDGGEGTLNVTGAGSSAVVSQYMTVGAAGTGVVNVSAGASVVNGNLLTLGLDAFRNGTVLMSGAGTSWEAGQHALIGNGGNGMLIIESGAAMDVAQILVLGNALTGNGQATITGAGSKLTFGDAFVGYDGYGFVWVENGGAFGGAGHDLTLGMGTNGEGNLQLTGPGSVATANVLTVAEEGRSVIVVSDGARLQTGVATLGNLAGSHGEVRLAGAGTVWANTIDDIFVGRQGEGLVTLSNGAKIEAVSYVRLGVDAGSTGTMSLTGQDTRLEAGVAIEVAKAGLAQVTVENGASVRHNDDLLIGQSAGAMGGVIVRGPGSTWQGLGDAIIGETGIGTFVIVDGASADFAQGMVLGSAGGGGAVQADGGTISAGTLVVGDTGSGVLVVEDGGSITVGDGTGTIMVAAQAGSNGHIGIGNGAGAGIIGAEKIQFGAGNADLFFAHTDTAYRFDLILAGMADIEHGSGYTTLTADSSGFLGTTAIWGGTLAVDGVLGGTVAVDANGTLGGSGTVGDVTVASGGRVAPGNSIGTLNVGNVVFDPGSELQVEVNGLGHADLVNAGGTATINGGHVAVLRFPDIATGIPYKILTAAGGVSGGFDSVAFGAGSLFITPTLSSDLNTVYVTLEQTMDFDAVALTPNQKAAAAGIQSLGSGEVFSAIAALGNAGDAQAAFDAISGEIHASAKTVLIEDSRYLREAALDRLRSAPGSSTSAEPEIWGQAFGAHGTWPGDDNAAGIERSLGGFLFGGDATLAGDWRFGVMAGYGQSSFTVADRASSGSAGNYYLGAYGGTDINGLGFKFGGSYSWHDLKIARSIAFSGFSDSVTANYWAGTGQVFGELGYMIEAGPARFEPFVNLAHVRLSNAGFSESGGAAKLNGGGIGTDATYATLGIRAETELLEGNIPLKLAGSIGWQHVFGNTTPQASLAFAGGNMFEVSGPPIARDALMLKLGFEAPVLPGATLGLTYGGQLSAGGGDHSLKASIGGKF